MCLGPEDESRVARQTVAGAMSRLRAACKRHLLHPFRCLGVASLVYVPRLIGRLRRLPVRGQFLVGLACSPHSKIATRSGRGAQRGIIYSAGPGFGAGIEIGSRELIWPSSATSAGDPWKKPRRKARQHPIFRGLGDHLRGLEFRKTPFRPVARPTDQPTSWPMSAATTEDVRQRSTTDYDADRPTGQ